MLPFVSVTMIRVQVNQAVCDIQLARPTRLNALTLASTQALLEAVREARRDDAVRALLLSGEGRAFCAGKDRDDPAGPEFVALLQALAEALMDCPKPVVAAVHGWAVGAGLELLLNCDLVLAARGARFMLPETHLGLFGTGGVAALLPRQAGLGRAKGILMLGEAFGAAQAERWGLVWAVLEDEAALHAEARRVARRLAGADPALMGRLKAALHREAVGDLRGVLAREADIHWQMR